MLFASGRRSPARIFTIGRIIMSNKFSRRGVLKSGAIAGSGLLLPTYLRAESHSGFTNAPTGSEVVFGFNTPNSTNLSISVGNTFMTE